MNYPKFRARWQPSGGAERANYGLFLTDLCYLLGIPRPDAAAQPWPAELAQQMQAVRAVVAQAAAPVTAAQVAARFRRTRATQVQPLLATLTALPPSPPRAGRFLRGMIASFFT